jgi:deazaflavin-dependent oxidoreductase (nitroreductase family)
MDRSDGTPQTTAGLEVLASATTCRVVTLGRRTGAQHDVRVWFAVAGGVVYAPVRNGRRSDWLRNAVAAARVEVEHGRTRWSGPAYVVEEPDELEHAIAALCAKYQRHRSIVTAWRREPPTVLAVVVDAYGGPRG